MFACVIACLHGQKLKEKIQERERELLAIRSERTSVEIYTSKEQEFTSFKS
jgi:hypothetical protein